MKKLIAVTLAGAMMCISYASFAADNTKMRSGRMDAKTMDTNGDNMISKDEYMTYYESQYDNMSKNNNGGVDVRTMNSWQRNNMRRNGTGTLNDSQIVN